MDDGVMDGGQMETNGDKWSHLGMESKAKPHGALSARITGALAHDGLTKAAD